MEIVRIDKESAYYKPLIDYAGACSWTAGSHLADLLKRDAFTDWESAFAAVENGQIAGFCTFMKTDYYPNNKYSPWISTIFVGEEYRGRRISRLMIEEVIKYAKKHLFPAVYIPSDIIGFYEKYGFEKIDELENYGGGLDQIFMKQI